jgi:hypothetical protein
VLSEEFMGEVKEVEQENLQVKMLEQLIWNEILIRKKNLQNTNYSWIKSRKSRTIRPKLPFHAEGD